MFITLSTPLLLLFDDLSLHTFILCVYLVHTHCRLRVLRSTRSSLALPLSPPTGIGFITVVNLGPGGQLLCSTVHLNIILLIKNLHPHHHHHCCPAPASALFSHGTILLFTQALTPSLHVKPRACHLKRGDVTFVSASFMRL